MQQYVQEWSKPAAVWIKANVDGALSRDQGSGASSAILRGSYGKFIACASHFFRVAADSEVVELLACRQAIFLAPELKVQKVIIVTDSQVAARKFVSHQKDLSANGQLVEEIKGLLRSFGDFKVAWVRR